jgi:hypothetical protein
LVGATPIHNTAAVQNIKEGWASAQRIACVHSLPHNGECVLHAAAREGDLKTLAVAIKSAKDVRYAAVTFAIGVRRVSRPQKRSNCTI